MTQWLVYLVISIIAQPLACMEQTLQQSQNSQLDVAQLYKEFVEEKKRNQPEKKARRRRAQEKRIKELEEQRQAYSRDASKPAIRWLPL